MTEHTHDSAPVTRAHIRRVQELMVDLCSRLLTRAIFHDQSKFDPVEKAPLDEMQRLIDTEGHAPYGTDEYRRRTALLRPMIEHHHANNSHHPEHYADGINGMDLLDIVEMFCDWRAANLERDNGAPMGLSHSIDRYKIDPQLAAIFRNTADRLGWPTK